MNLAAAKVFAELSFAVGQGLQDAVMADATQRSLVLSDGARDYWLKGHSKSVPKALKKKGRNWKKDRRGVLLMARVLGATAGQLAYKAAGQKSGTVHVTAKQAERATKRVRKDPRCVAFAARRAGGGVYCEF